MRIGHADSTTAEAIASMLAGRPVDRPRLYREVLDRIEQLIVSGRLRPGDRLPSERELMRLFGVGRTSIREALFALQRKGVLVASAGGRPIVTAPSADLIVTELSGAVRYYLATESGAREFQRARRLLEPALARHAARHATDVQIARLRTAFDANETALAEPERFIDTDVDFHFAIVEMAESELIGALHRAVFGWLRTQRTLSIGPAGSAKAAVAAHRAILEAIAARDPDAAEAAMDVHLRQVESFYWQAEEFRRAERSSSPGRSATNLIGRME